MLSNKFNLITVFGILILGIGLLCLGVAGQFFQEYYRNSFGGESDEETLARIAFLTFGIIVVILSIALMLRFRWARIGLTILFWLGMISWTLLLGFTLLEDRNAWPFFIGLSGLVYTQMIFGILFLGNKYVVMHFEDKHHQNEEHPEVLDL